MKNKNLVEVCKNTKRSVIDFKEAGFEIMNYDNDTDSVNKLYIPYSVITCISDVKSYSRNNEGFLHYNYDYPNLTLIRYAKITIYVMNNEEYEFYIYSKVLTNPIYVHEPALFKNLKNKDKNGYPRLIDCIFRTEYKKNLNIEDFKSDNNPEMLKEIEYMNNLREDLIKHYEEFIINNSYKL